MSKLPRKPFVFWFNSLPDPVYPRTKNNTPESFVVQLPEAWQFEGSWDVKCLSCVVPEINVARTPGDLLLYTDIIRYALVGHDYFPLVDRITANTNPRFQQTKHPMIRRVNDDRYEHMTFKIADVQGKPPHWKDTSGNTVLSLEFIPVEPRDPNLSDMDQTFLSNQSKDYYPLNNASSFICKLPVPARMSEGWEIGVTKITLPPVLTKRTTNEFTVYLSTSVPLPTGVPTSFTLKNESSVHNLGTKFSAKIEEVLSGWKKADGTRLVGGAQGGTGPDDMRIIIKDDGDWGNEAHNHVFKDITSLESLNKKLKQHGFKNGMMPTRLSNYGGTIYEDSRYDTNDDNKFLFFDLDSKNYRMDYSGLMTHLGVDGPTTLAWGITAQNRIIYSCRKKPFEGKIYLPFVDCRLETSKGQSKLWVGFYDPSGLNHLTLSMPHGLYKLLGFNDDGVPVSIRDNGEKYVDITAKQGYKHPHAIDDPADTVGWRYLENNQTTYVEGLPSLIDTPVEYDVLLAAKPPMSNAYVTCSIVTPHHVGDREIPLIETIPLASVNQGTNGESKDYVYEPTHVKYTPLGSTSFQTIQFTIEDEQRKLIPLLDDYGATTITLNYRQNKA